jgi:ankyrin repeat protein
MNQKFILEDLSDEKNKNFKNINKNNNSFEENIFEFIEKGDSEKINFFFKNPKIKFWEFLDNDGNTILIKLAYVDNKIIFDFLELSKKKLNPKQLKIFIDVKANNGFTALHYASFKGNVKLCEKLIELNADYKIVNNNGLNLIHMAAQGDQPETLVLFKDKYKLDLTSKDNVSSSSIHWAAYMGSEICLDYLASWKMPLNSKDKDGFTPLHLAVMTGNFFN